MIIAVVVVIIIVAAVAGYYLLILPASSTTSTSSSASSSSATIAPTTASSSSSLAPIKIGLVIQLTGGLALAGVPGLTAVEIWANQTNSAGGILHHPVQLIYYDDQSDTSKVPALIQKLVTVDNVDFLATLGTVDTAAAMPVASQSGKILLGIYGTNANAGYNYTRFFQAAPIGPDPNIDQVKGFFELANSLNPKPLTFGMIAVQNDFGQQCQIGGSALSAQYGFKVVFNQTYPPSVTDFTTIIQQFQASHPDIAYVCSYPVDSIGVIQAMKQNNFSAKLIGGGMIGPQVIGIQASLGKTLQGLVTFAYWVPEKTLNFPGVNEFITKYQAVANATGAAAFDPLGYLYPPYSYAVVQMLGEAITQCGCLGNDSQLASFIHSHSFTTIGGNMSFAPSGEWSYSRVLWIQFQNISANSVQAFAGPGHQIIVWPAQYKSGNLSYPFPGWSG